MMINVAIAVTATLRMLTLFKYCVVSILVLIVFC